MAAADIARILRNAVQHHKAGQLPQAEALYRQVLQHDPNCANAWSNLGVIAATAGKHAVAAQLFTKALGLDPPSNVTRFNLAASLKAAGKRTEALALFREAWKREFGPGFALAGDFGVRELVRRLCFGPLIPWMIRLDHLRAYAELIEEQGAFRGLEPLLEEVRASVALTDAPPTELQARLFTLLDALGFLKTSDKQWNARVFHELALPWMKDALALGHYDLALTLESKVYDTYVRQTETEQHFRGCFNQWVPAMCEAGRRAGSSLGPVPWPQGGGVPVVGFFLHKASLLAHVEVLINMLEGWVSLDAKPFIPRVYAFSGNYPPMVERFDKLGVPVTLLKQSCPEAGQDWYRRLLCLRERCTEDKVTALVWVSYVGRMPFAFALRLAPVQIWWAMKYHSLDFPEIDDYIANGSFETHREINGRNWRVVHGGLTNFYRPELSAAALGIKKRFGDRLILGCMGREEKMDNLEYLRAVSEILKQRPDTTFLWTGRQPSVAVVSYFDREGLGNRHQYVGWIDTKLYAQVLDVYLDTFPFGGGHTVFQAMAAGVPTVMLLSPENLETGVAMHIMPVIRGAAGTPHEQEDVRGIFATDGESLFPIFEGAPDYIRFALQLIDDSGFRSRAGQAGRLFVERYVSNVQRFAESFSCHIKDILNQRSL